MVSISKLDCKKTYISNSEVVLEHNMVPALSFLLMSKMELTFDLVNEEFCMVISYHSICII